MRDERVLSIKVKIEELRFVFHQLPADSDMQVPLLVWIETLRRKRLRYNRSNEQDVIHKE